MSDETTTAAPEQDAQETEQTSEQPKADEAKQADEKTFTQADVDKMIRDRLTRERSKYADYDDLKTKAAKADELSQAQAEHDTATVAAAADLATAKLEASLARAGMSQEQVAVLTEHIDPLRLLDEGKPSTEAIDKIAESLSQSLNHVPPDPDQGQSSGAPPQDLNAWMRGLVRN